MNKIIPYESKGFLVRYDPVRCVTHIGDIVISDYALAEFGLTLEQFIDGMLRAKFSDS